MEIKHFYQEKLQEEMYYTTHESGLRVYVFPKKGFHKYYAIYGTRYGSMDRVFQIPGEAEMTAVPDGIAHYLEHKLFAQEDGSDAFQLFAETGGSSNAYTGFDMTAYLFTCTDRFYENLDILLEFVNHPYFTEENVAKEQGIIGQEIKMYDDDPEWRVFFNTLTAMYHNNPVKIDIAGTVESIAKITPELLYRCYRAFYNPANMALVIVGDVDMNEVLSYVDKYVDPKRNLGEIPRKEVAEPKERVRERVTQKMVVSRPMFRIGFKDNDFSEDVDAMLEKEITTEILLDAVFGGCSELYRELYDQGLIDAGFEAEADISGRYGFSLAGGESEDPEAVYARVKDYLKKLQKEGIPKEDIIRAKKGLIADEMRLFNGPERQGNLFLRQVFAGRNPLQFVEAVERVSDEAIIRRLKDHFNPDNAVLSVILPSGK